MFKLQKRAIRIVANSKYNAHTEPLFKLYGILKLSDVLTLQTMKVYHKFRHNELPVYMQNWPLITNNEIHQYNTRIASDLHTFRYHHSFARKSLRHYLVQTINNTPDNVFSKFGTHSLIGFSNYVKLNFINNYYQDDCNIQNGYIIYSQYKMQYHTIPHANIHTSRHTHANALAHTPSRLHHHTHTRMYTRKYAHATSNMQYTHMKSFGLLRNNLANILHVDHIESPVTVHTKYYTVEDLSEFLDKQKNKLTILSLNIDSLNSKFDDLSIIVNNLAKSNARINIICIQEARIGQCTDIEHVNLEGYSMITQAYTEKCSKKGGLVTYVSNNINIVNYKTFNTFTTWEGLSLDIIDNSGIQITICNVYRPPKYNNNHAAIESFFKDFSPMIRNINSSSKNLILTGDFNID